jgi:hypothetical protein
MGERDIEKELATAQMAQEVTSLSYMSRIQRAMDNDEVVFESREEMDEFAFAVKLLVGAILAHDAVFLRMLLLSMGLGNIAKQFRKPWDGDNTALRELQKAVREGKRQGLPANPMMYRVLRKAGVPEEDLP